MNMKKIISSIILSLVLIQSAHAETWDYHLPWYFWNNQTIHAYEWIEEDLLDNLQVTFELAKSSGIWEFWKTAKTFQDDYDRISWKAKSMNFGNMQKFADETLSDPLAKELFINYWPSFLAREHWGNKEQNPWNKQWCYQITSIQLLFNACDNNAFAARSSLFSCEDVKRVYEWQKLLTQDEQDMQSLDLIWFLHNKMSDIDKKLNAGFDNNYSYRTNLMIWLKALVWPNKYPEEELQSYVNAIVLKENNKLIPLLSKEQQSLSSVWINSVEDFTKWLLYARLAYFGWSYNGWWNNNAWRPWHYTIYNLLDHAYNSNYPMYWIYFRKSWSDGSAATTKDKQNWFIQTYMEWMDNGSTRWLEFATLLKVLQKNWDLPMTVQ